MSFEIPESPHNLKIGMFMTKFELLKNSTSIFISKRSCTLSYQSYFVKLIWKSLNIFLLISNLISEKQNHFIEMIISKDEFILNDLNQKIKQADTIRVSLMNTNIHLYNSNIDFFGEIGGWRYYIYHYRTSTILILFCFGTIFISQNSEEENEDENIEEEIVEHFEIEDDKDEEKIELNNQEIQDSGIDKNEDLSKFESIIESTNENEISSPILETEEKSTNEKEEIPNSSKSLTKRKKKKKSK
eukprot:gene549-8061_t